MVTSNQILNTSVNKIFWIFKHVILKNSFVPPSVLLLLGYVPQSVCMHESIIYYYFDCLLVKFFRRPNSCPAFFKAVACVFLFGSQLRWGVLF